jgi:hypothetical protein
MLAVIETTSPTLDLVTGGFDTEFGDYEQVNNAEVTFDNPATSKLLFSTSISISGNTVTVIVMVQDMNSVGAWVAATTAQVNGKKFTIIADCD